MESLSIQIPQKVYQFLIIFFFHFFLFVVAYLFIFFPFLQFSESVFLIKIVFSSNIIRLFLEWEHLSLSPRCMALKSILFRKHSSMVTVKVSTEKKNECWPKRIPKQSPIKITSKSRTNTHSYQFILFTFGCVCVHEAAGGNCKIRTTNCLVQFSYLDLFASNGIQSGDEEKQRQRELQKWLNSENTCLICSFMSE